MAIKNRQLIQDPKIQIHLSFAPIPIKMHKLNLTEKDVKFAVDTETLKIKGISDKI